MKSNVVSRVVIGRESARFLFSFSDLFLRNLNRTKLLDRLNHFASISFSFAVWLCLLDQLLT